MVVTHSNTTQEKWQTKNLYRFQKTKCNHKEEDEMLNIIARYEAYVFLDGYLGYHQIFITLEEKYEITFIIDLGAFIWKVMLFGVKNGLPTYQKVITKTFKEYLDSFMKIFLDGFIEYSDMENHL